MRTEIEHIVAKILVSLDLIEKRYDLNKCRDKVEELNAISEQNDFWNDNEFAQKIMKERQSLITNIETCQDFRRTLDDTIELIDLAESENDKLVISEAEAVLSQLLSDIKIKEMEALLNGEMDSCDTFLEINAGAGGTESCDWAQMLSRMYLRFAEKKGFKIELISQNNGEDAGIKSATYKLRGLNAYGLLRHESGVHRLVRISPFDSNSRRHTSFSSVWVYPVVNEDIDICINPSDIRTDTFRASGSGGQHVNTTDSAVRITHLPTGIVVTSSEKSQHQNRANCMDALRSRLYERELKKKLQGIQEQHDQKGDAGWGNQIRSYVLHPYQMVKDLRTQKEVTDTQAVLDGSIDTFIYSALAKLAT